MSEDLTARLAAAELVCQLVAGMAVGDETPEHLALLQAWIDWSNVPGAPPTMNRAEMAPTIASLVERRKAVRAKVTAKIREKYGPEAAAFYANGGGPVTSAPWLLIDMAEAHRAERDGTS